MDYAKRFGRMGSLCDQDPTERLLKPSNDCKQIRRSWLQPSIMNFQNLTGYHFAINDSCVLEAVSVFVLDY